MVACMYGKLCDNKILETLASPGQPGNHKEVDDMPTVDTLFIDASTGKAIGQADMPVEQLPQSFANETTFHIGDEEWSVLTAEPLTAEEFIQTGKLVLTLQKVVKVPAGHILFTLPTLCNEIPPIVAGSTKQGKNIFELHEDDWRQIGFVSHTYRHAIDSELAHIMRIYREASVNDGHALGFKSLHVRQQINVPFQEKIPLNQLDLFFTSVPYRYEGVSYQQAEGLIEGGFAFRVAPVLFYGQHVEGMVKSLSIKVVGKAPGANTEIVHSLQELMKIYHLDLVDWCKPQLIIADAEMISTFLEG